MKIDKISLIGLGKLGLPLLVTFANNGQKIIGIDIDQEKINLLKDKKIPFFEPNLNEYLKSGYDNIDLNTTFNNVVNETDVFIITRTLINRRFLGRTSSFINNSINVSEEDEPEEEQESEEEYEPQEENEDYYDYEEEDQDSIS